MTRLGSYPSSFSLPILMFDGKSIKPMSEGIDKDAQSHVERIGERKQVKRGEAK
jgi:hypothetical protein